MIAFLDTSALAQNYLPGRASADVRRLLRTRKKIALSSLTFAELSAAIARAWREGRINRGHCDEAFARLPRDFKQVTLVEPRWRVIQRASQLVLAYPLRSFDAMQLSSCIEIRRDTATELWAGDGDLVAAARREGIKVVAL